MSKLNARARALLDTARHEEPPDELRRRVDHKLSSRLAALGLSSAAVTTASTAGAAPASQGAAAAKSLFWTKAVLTKVLLASVVSVGAVGAWYGYRTARSPSAPSARAIPTSTFAHPETAPKPIIVPQTVPDAPVVSVESLGKDAPARSAPASATELPAQAQHPSSLEAETQALREVQGAMRDGQPDRALQLLNQRSFKNAVLDEERDAARAIALCQSGKVDEGQFAAKMFLQQYPRSPLVVRVRDACNAAR
ncbi:MAG TPA: hypothetical protein VGJ84_03950 [Polyangiaceae bacterium]|jgi:hypothetical protein